ncbi:MAG: metallophosphoesterase [Thermoguttaceae bacterium]|jgi:predicted MPP superfamily phosphohydrolase
MSFVRWRRKRITRFKRSPLRFVAESVFIPFFFLGPLLYPANNALTVSEYDVASGRLPDAFDGYVVVQVSDLHCKEFGPRNDRLIAAIEREKPDLIVVTGDLLDCRHFKLDVIRTLITRLVELAPVYYVVGNHEADLSQEYFDEVVDLVQDSGATALLGEQTRIERGADHIALAGVREPFFTEPYVEKVDAQLRALTDDAADEFRILLSHRPEALPLYAKHRFDLVFAGHAHGGQFRIPWLCPNGLNAPGQGWFPKLTAGVHVDGPTTLVISRGLGPSVIPTRLWNRPDLVVCRLHKS